jgi:hypothetical protein
LKDVLDAPLDIHARGYCFVDVKATNICLVIGEARGALIDAASVVPFEQNIIEYTKGFCLDFLFIAKPSFVLYCVASLAFYLFIEILDRRQHKSLLISYRIYFLENSMSFIIQISILFY